MIICRLEENAQLFRLRFQLRQTFFDQAGGHSILESHVAYNTSATLIPALEQNCTRRGTADETTITSVVSAVKRRELPTAST